ncbi:MAG: FHIPEP family type III secretion protein [Thermoguttaceae bacterium]|nr:FHIPEP family type III secretion protein [Thermoguttaceae bacterium]MBR4105511.1 FHIPEP family type III secretion protein [Thermoguttaceae bacterium]
MGGAGETAKKFRWQDAALPIFAAAAVLALLFALPTPLMDLLLSFNLAISVVIFVAVFFVRKPLDFNVFPTILLATTLFRLVLNVSTTRLILTQADAGEVVDAFARFVAGDSVVVGLVIFLIFVIIQFVVITKGATRISEVSARFALDALPGRQMAIDADVAAGNLTDAEARAAREELAEQADFFGAMDGASKFVRGDAVAGLAIVLINIIGGLVVGIGERGLGAAEAFSLYSKLTIGDGLTSQIPAFLISLATGLLVARTSRPQNVSEAALAQVFGRPIALALTGVFLVFLAATGLPIAPLAVLATGFFLLAWAVSRKREKEAVEEKERKEAEEANKAEQTAQNPDDVDEFLTVEPMELEIGLGLIPLADPADGENLLERVRRTRRRIASELGFVLPKTRVRDNPKLDDGQFAIKIKGETVALATVYPTMLFAVDAGFAFGTLPGLQTTSPLDGATAYWIDPRNRAAAESAGYEVWDAATFVEMQLLRTARREAAELLTRDATKRLVDRLRETSPTVVDDLIPGAMKLAQIQQVLQLLLREGVSIRRLDSILETLGDFAARESNPYRLLDRVRVRMARTLSAKNRDEDGTLRVAMFEPEAEDALRSAAETTEFGVALTLSATELEALGAAVRESGERLRESGAASTLLVDGAIRNALREATWSAAPDVDILAFDEIDRSTKIVQEAVVDWTPEK